MSCLPAASMMRSMPLVPSRRPFSRSSTSIGDVTETQPDETAPGCVAHRHDERGLHARLNRHLLRDAAEVALERHRVLTRRDLDDRHRSFSERRAVDADACARRLRANLQLAERRHGLRQLEVLRDVGAGGDGDRNRPRFSVRAHHERVRAGRQRRG